jgi:predicted nucleotidyltransferase
MDVIKIESQISKIVEEFVEKLVDICKEELELVVLFGSYARGDFNKRSDVDFLVVLKHRHREIVDKIYEEVTDALIKDEVDISLKIYTSDQYSKMAQLGTPFIREIQKTGIVLWKTQ